MKSSQVTTWAPDESEASGAGLPRWYSLVLGLDVTTFAEAWAAGTSKADFSTHGGRPMHWSSSGWRQLEPTFFPGEKVTGLPIESVVTDSISDQLYSTL